MTLYSVDLPRDCYLGNRMGIMEWHVVLSIGLNMDPYYDTTPVDTIWGSRVDGHRLVGYRYSFVDRVHAMLFHLRWCR